MGAGRGISREVCETSLREAEASCERVGGGAQLQGAVTGHCSETCALPRSLSASVNVRRQSCLHRSPWSRWGRGSAGTRRALEWQRVAGTLPSSKVPGSFCSCAFALLPQKLPLCFHGAALHRAVGASHWRCSSPGIRSAG